MAFILWLVLHGQVPLLQGILLPSRFLEIKGSDKACESAIRAVIAGLGPLLFFFHTLYLQVHKPG